MRQQVEASNTEVERLQLEKKTHANISSESRKDGEGLRTLVTTLSSDLRAAGSEINKLTRVIADKEQQLEGCFSEIKSIRTTLLEKDNEVIRFLCCANIYTLLLSSFGCLD